jgi:hypothetical protein
MLVLVLGVSVHVGNTMSPVLNKKEVGETYESGRTSDVISLIPSVIMKMQLTCVDDEHYGPPNVDNLYGLSKTLSQFDYPYAIT